MTKLGITLAVRVCHAMQSGVGQAPHQSGCFAFAALSVLGNHYRSSLATIGRALKTLLAVVRVCLTQCVHLPFSLIQLIVRWFPSVMRVLFPYAHHAIHMCAFSVDPIHLSISPALEFTERSQKRFVIISVNIRQVYFIFSFVGHPFSDRLPDREMSFYLGVCLNGCFVADCRDDILSIV